MRTTPQIEPIKEVVQVSHLLFELERFACALKLHRLAANLGAIWVTRGPCALHNRLLRQVLNEVLVDVGHIETVVYAILNENGRCSKVAQAQSICCTTIEYESKTSRASMPAFSN
jgi:hypothetical protein